MSSPRSSPAFEYNTAEPTLKKHRVFETEASPLALQEAATLALFDNNPAAINDESSFQYVKKVLTRSSSFIIHVDPETHLMDVYEPTEILGEGKYGVARLFTSTIDKSKQLCVKHPTPYAKASKSAFFNTTVMNNELALMKTVYPSLGKYQIQFFLSETNKVLDYRYIMPYFKGTRFNKITDNLKDINLLPRWILALAVELQRVHSLNIIHNDLKPENIIGRTVIDTETTQEKCEVIIVDFGQSKQIGDKISRHKKRPNYMAPEVSDFTSSFLTAETTLDIYSLAWIIWATMKRCQKLLPNSNANEQQHFQCLRLFSQNGMQKNPKDRPTLASFIEKLTEDVNKVTYNSVRRA